MSRAESSSNHKRKALEDMLHGVTTPININDHDEIDGTGFFYYELPNTEHKGKQIYKDVWLVTNRHVVLEHNNIEELKKLKFNTRRIGINNKVYWNNIIIDGSDLIERLRLCSNETIDVAAIKVTDKIEKYHPNLNLFDDYGFFAVSETLLPENLGQQIESGDDVVIVGYPRGLHIQENLFPIIKSSCLSSKWGSFFDGFPYFIIDRRLVNGSSGSLVITKPTNFILSQGKTLAHEIKQFMILGIYSGTPSPLYHGTDSGIVWYCSLIKEVIESSKIN